MRAWTCAGPCLAAAARERFASAKESRRFWEYELPSEVRQNHGQKYRIRRVVKERIADDLLALASYLEPNRLGVSDQASSRGAAIQGERGRGRVQWKHLGELIRPTTKTRINIFTVSIPLDLEWPC